MGFYSELFIMNCFTTSVTKRLNSTESTKRYEIWFLKVLFQTIFKMRNKKCNSVQFTKFQCHTFFASQDIKQNV